MKNLRTIKEKLLSLQKEVSEAEKAIASIIQDAIVEIAQQAPIKRVSKNAFVVNSSQLTGKPWNPEYYDWEAAAKVLFTSALKCQAPQNWKETLESLLHEAKAKRRSFVVCVMTTYFEGKVFRNSVPISLEFVELIIKKLQDYETN